jgi:hypothetical protein
VPTPFEDLPGFDTSGMFNEAAVRRAEGEVRRWTAGRPGIDTRSPFLPGGRQLSWTELNELSYMMGEGYGFHSLIDEIMKGGAPFDPVSGKGVSKGPFYWAVPFEPGETRAYGRVAVPRETMLNTEDPALFALTQSSFQYREERKALLDSGAWAKSGFSGWSAVFPSSGQRLDLDSIHRLIRQKKNFLNEEGTRVIFDLETASLMPEHGIRQLSYRVVDKMGKATSKTLNFENAIMGLGHYSEALKDVEGKIVDGKVVREGLIPQERMADELIEFFQEAGSARYLIGQNAMFDVGMLQRVKQTNLYARGEKVLNQFLDKDGSFRPDIGKADLDSYISALTGRDQTAARLKRSAEGFFANAYSDNFVDTAAHARVLMTEVGKQRLSVAPEILERGEGKLFSIENIMLQSSFLQDIVDSGIADKQEVQKMFEGSGLHAADVDTWFTDKLSQLQKLSYANETNASQQYYLRPEHLDQKAVDKIWGKGTDVATVRQKITSARAITPFTGIAVKDLPRESLDYLENIGGSKEWVDQLTASDRHLTGFEHMMLMSRDLAVTSPAAIDFNVAGEAADTTAAKDLAKKSGILSRYFSDRDIFNETGALNPFGRFPTLGEQKRLGQELLGAGYHFGGLSFGEHIITQTMAAASQIGDVAIDRARKLLAETAPVSVWQGSTLAAFPLRTQTAKTAAIPLDILQEMEERGTFGIDVPLAGGGVMKKEVPLLINTNITGAREGEALQWLGISPFQYRDWRNRTVEDVAMTVKGAIQTDPFARDEQIRAIMGFLGERNAGLAPEKQITAKMLERIEQGLRATGHTTGIQVATLAGPGGSKGATKVYNLLKALGMDVDQKGGGLFAPLLFGRQVGEATQVGAGPFMTGALDALNLPTVREQVLAGLPGLRTTYSKYEDALLPDKRLLSQLGSPLAQKAKSWAERMPEWVTKYITPQMRPRTLAVVGAAAAVGYYWHKHKANRGSDAAVDPMPFEDAGFYARYKSDIRETVPAMPMAGRGKSGYPLATASLPSFLDNNKSGHYNMSSDKNSFLFGG